MTKTKRRKIITNEEASAKLQKKSQAKIFEGIARDWEAAETAGKEAAKLQIVAINRLRDCGLKLQEAANHEQVSFGFYDFHRDDLPKAMHFKAVKFCIHLARNLGKPVESIDEARKAAQMMLVIFDQAEAPRRLEPQNAHEHNAWSDFIAGAATFTRLFEELEEAPMAEWSKDKLQKFVATTKPIVDKHNEAKGLL